MAAGQPERRQRRLLRVGEVADYLGLSVDTVLRMCGQGRLPHVKIGRSIRFEPDVIAEWLARHRRGNGGGGAPSR